MFTDGPGPWLLYSSTYQASPANGLDLWRLSLATGAPAPVRVTRFNDTAYAVVSAPVFDPADPHTIYAGVALDANAKNVDAYKIVP